LARKALLNFISQGIYVGGVRGRDSTGMMTVDRDNYQVEVNKQAVDGGVFLDQYNVDKALFDVEDYSCAVVHHRKASAGAIISKNAHPFQRGAITLVHNGTVMNHRALPGGTSITVDSDAIANALATEDTISVLEKLDGAFTLIWFDSTTNTLNLAKNNERPLSIAYTKNDNILFASESGMLNWLAGRNMIDITSSFSPTPYTLYSWKVDDAEQFSARNFTTQTFEEFDDPYKYAYNNYGGYGKGADGKCKNWETGASTASQAGASNRVTFPQSPFTSTGTKTEREKSLAKFSIKVGDTIRFIGYAYEAYSVNTAQGIMRGVDESMQFETISYSVAPTARGGKDWHNALCEGVVLTVKDDEAYPYWVTVVVTQPTLVTENFFEKKSFEKIVDSVFSQPNEPSKESSTASDKEATEMVVAAGGHYITKKEWDKQTLGGCSNCSCNLYHPEDVVWTYEGNPLCQWCVNDDEYAELVLKGI